MGGETMFAGFDLRSISPVAFIPQASAVPISFHDPTAGGALRTFTVPVLTYTCYSAWR